MLLLWLPNCPRAYQVPKDLQGVMVCLAPQEPLGSQVLLEREDLLDQLGKKERWVRWAVQGQRDCKDLRVKREWMGHLDCQGNEDHRDHQDLQAGAMLVLM